MTEKRFRTGKGILEEGYFSETIIDNETGKTYYKGYANYKSSKEICELLNKLIDENDELKEEHKRIIDLLDKKLQENDDNDEYARRVKINLIMELKKELEK